MSTPAPKANIPSTPQPLSTPTSDLVGGRHLQTTHSLESNSLDTYITNLTNSENISIGEKVTYTQNNQSTPLDIPTFINYFYHKYKGERKIIFSDLTEDEILHSQSSQDLAKVKQYVNWMSTLSVTSWFFSINSYGCSKCSSFLDKQSIQPWPTPVMHLLSDKVIDFSNRELMMAYHIYQTLMDPQYNKKYPEDKTHFLAITRDLDYLKVSKRLCEFIKDKEKVVEFENSFLAKYRPQSSSNSFYKDLRIYDKSYRK